MQDINRVSHLCELSESESPVVTKETRRVPPRKGSRSTRSTGDRPSRENGKGFQICFRDQKLSALYFRGTGVGDYPPGVLKSFFRVMTFVAAAVTVKDLYAFRSLRFHKMRGGRAGQFSADITGNLRMLMTIDVAGRCITVLGIVDTH